jgi:hypothetical protein
VTSIQNAGRARRGPAFAEDYGLRLDLWKAARAARDARIRLGRARDRYLRGRQLRSSNRHSESNGTPPPNPAAGLAAAPPLPGVTGVTGTRFGFARFAEFAGLAGRIDVPIGAMVCAPRGGGGGLRTGGVVEMVGASDVPIVGALDVPIVGSSGVPIVAAVGVPIVGGVEAPIVGCSDVPIVGCVGVPIVGLVEVPIEGNVAGPIAASGGMPSAGNASDRTSGNSVPAADVAFAAPGITVEALVPGAGERICAPACVAMATASADAATQRARLLMASLLVSFARSRPVILALRKVRHGGGGTGSQR